MPLLAWNGSYSVGVKTIDQQHSVLFGIVNELHAAMMKGQAQSVVGPLLDKLVKYTHEHFAYEERMMDAAKYPGLVTHRAHHADLTRQVGEFMTRYKRGERHSEYSVAALLEGLAHRAYSACGQGIRSLGHALWRAVKLKSGIGLSI